MNNFYTAKWMYCIFQHKSEDSSEEPHLTPIAEDQTVLSIWTQMQKYSQTRTEELQIQQHPLQLLGNENGNRHSQMMSAYSVCGCRAFENIC